MAKAPPILEENMPRTAINMTLQLVFSATNVPQNFQHLNVPKGLSVQLGGSNGTAANAQTAYAALQPEKLKTGNGRVIIPPSTSAADSANFTVDNAAQIWCMGTVGDGVQLVIRGTSIG